MSDASKETTDRQFSVPMPDGSRAMLDSFGGDELDITTSKGVVRFEFSQLFGPMPVTKTGTERELGPRHPFWRAASLWKLQGCRTENGEAIWHEPSAARFIPRRKGCEVMNDTPEATKNAQLLIESVRSALRNGVKHFSKEGEPLTTELAIVSALVRDGEIILHD